VTVYVWELMQTSETMIVSDVPSRFLPHHGSVYVVDCARMSLLFPTLTESYCANLIGHNLGYKLSATDMVIKDSNMHPFPWSSW
jgi:hypothetical protein